jgi:meromycolic acid (3R)-3-hydroxyacyl-[acyl-carrier protein] dehydratase HadC
VNERFGADIVQTRNLALDENGDLYLEAFTTLMGHEGDNSVSLKYDLESGQVVRTVADPAEADAPGADSEPKAD